MIERTLIILSMMILYASSYNTINIMTRNTFIGRIGLINDNPSMTTSLSFIKSLNTIPSISFTSLYSTPNDNNSDNNDNAINISRRKMAGEDLGQVRIGFGRWFRCEGCLLLLSSNSIYSHLTPLTI